MPTSLRRSSLALSLALAACSKSDTPEAKQLDPSLIEVVDGARLRTDTVGDGEFASTSAFVLVDAKNPTSEGAYVTLAGQLLDASATKVGDLKAQSLWIPSHDLRTFALVDTERVPRPSSTSVRVVVTGALVTHDPPRARITDLHEFPDNGRIVVQANVVNDADRIGKVVVIASFHGADDRPITRPFEIVEIDRKQTKPIQFVGPDHSTHGTIFIGDVIY